MSREQTQTPDLPRPAGRPRPGGMREVILIALPMVVSYACDTVMTFTDRLFLARLGPEMMNAAMVGGLSAFMMMTFFLGLIGYSTALVAQYLGAGRKDRCAVALAQALLIAVAAYPVILACRPLAHRLFDVMGMAPEQLAPQRLYFDILLYGVLFSLCRNAFSGFFSGIGRTRVVMMASLTAMTVNIALNYVLIFGRFGAPALGIRGAAYGTIIGTICGLLVLVAAFLRRENREEFGIARALRFDWPVMRTLLRFGYPSGLELFLNLLAFDLIVMLFHSAGLMAATAATVVLNWDMVSFVPLIGIEIGVTSLVGRYMGARDPDTAHRATMSGLKVGLMYSSVILVLFVGFPGPLADMFRSGGEALVFEQARPMAVAMIRLAALYVLVEAVVVVLSGALRGAGDTLWNMGFWVSMHWVLVATLYATLHVAGLGVVQSWTVFIVLFVGLSVLIVRRYRGGRWRTLEVVRVEERVAPTTLASRPVEPFHETPDL